ncbi:MAG: NAD-dependent malic enzyme [Saprospiraceae bacterium]|nr:NAD-dependent malic enzyme [Saprospiraceae bacterium]
MQYKSELGPEDRGVKLFHDPILNKGTAFTEEEREQLGLRGLLPPRIMSQELQAKRVLENLRLKPNDLERYIFMVSLQDRNEHLFYRTVVDHLEEIMPIIYTPTVGKACQSYGHLFRRSRGLYISIEDKGRIHEILHNWPYEDVRVIVVTDGERILGLGDLGIDGMGIPIGKLSLYTACAGIHPAQCLPITIDVGTNNTHLLADDLYMGLKHPRIQGEAYNALLEEFVMACQDVFPNVLIQLEDFATTNAFHLLQTYRDRVCLFNDDIQGTASVALAGVYSALRLTGKSLKEQRFLFFGAGEAGTGIADILAEALTEEGLDIAEARQHCWLVDSNGLVCQSRQNLAPHKKPYAHDCPPAATLLEAIEQIRPTALIGVSGQGGRFTKEVIEAMSALQERPIIFALSNPTDNSECTAEQAYFWSKGKAIFASGSPFPSVKFEDKLFKPGQGNNVYIFPGIGLGVTYSHATRVTNRMFLEAARIVADAVTEEDWAAGQIYPSLRRIREVSIRIAAAVSREAVRAGLSKKVLSDHLEEDIRQAIYDPAYPIYV